MTKEQNKLRFLHGTPKEFAAACDRALGEISIDERNAAVRKYEQEWDIAGLPPAPANVKVRCGPGGADKIVEEQ